VPSVQYFDRNSSAIVAIRLTPATRLDPTRQLSGVGVTGVKLSII